MSSLGSILSIARSALQTQQSALQTIGQNVANAGVEGYSRQTLRVSAQVPQAFPYGNIGTGVVVQGVTRSRDVLLDDQFRAAAGQAAFAETSSDVLGRIEAVLGEPSESGLATSMDNFFNAWSDLATNPASASTRGVVRQRGDELVGAFNGAAARLDETSRSTRARLTTDVAQLNGLLKQVAQINPAVVAAESNNRSANDLRDTRDRLLDAVSRLADTQRIEHSDGSVALYVAGRLVVDADVAQQLQVSSGVPASVTFVGQREALSGIGGSIAAALDGVNTRIPDVQRRLDALAGALVNGVNQIHTTGTVYSGNPPVASTAGKFFDQTGGIGSGDPLLTAWGMRLNQSVGTVFGIAAADGGAAGIGNNGVASRIAALRDSTFTLYDSGGSAIATGTLGGFYRDTVADVGLASNQASSAASTQTALASQANSRRESVSGVATDEELVALIKHQQAYAAAARLVSVVDEMAKTLISLG